MSRLLRVSARTIPMFAVMGGIFFLSSMPGDHLVLPEIVNIDKAAHMAIYGLLAGAVFFAFGGRLVEEDHGPPSADVDDDFRGRENNQSSDDCRD